MFLNVKKTQIHRIASTNDDNMSISVSINHLVKHRQTRQNLQNALDKHSNLLQRQVLSSTKNIITCTEFTNTNPSLLHVTSSNAASNYSIVSTSRLATTTTAATTATILVSKSKTKTGLPLLLKNSINDY